MNIAMPHLIAQKMNRSIHFCEQGSKCVAQIMIFEFDPQLAFDFASGVLHGIDCLDGSIGEASHQLQRRDFLAIDIINESLLLLANGCELLRLRLQHFCSGNQMIAQNITHVDCPSGIARLGGNQFDYSLLVLHLPVNGDGSILQINITPFQAKGFIDPQATVPSQKVCSFGIGSLEVFIQERKLLMGKGNNVSVILCLILVMRILVSLLTQSLL